MANALLAGEPKSSIMSMVLRCQGPTYDHKAKELRIPLIYGKVFFILLV